MDCLKLMGDIKEELQKPVQRVRIFSEVIYTEFEVGKCAKIALKKKNPFSHKININSEVHVQENRTNHNNIPYIIIHHRVK